MAALDALDAGHMEAAQALAGSLIDRNGKRTKDAYDEFSVRQFVAFAPMWQTYQQFFVADGDKVPMTFSRNATAHTVSPRQFNRRNAVQDIMVACSLLYRLDEEARALEVVTEVSGHGQREADPLSRPASNIGLNGMRLPIQYKLVAERYLEPRASGARQAGEILPRKDPPPRSTITGELWGMGVAALRRRTPGQSGCSKGTFATHP